MGSNPALNRWRADVSAHPLKWALVAGFIAVHLSTVVGFWWPIIGVPKTDFFTFNGVLQVPDASPLAQFIVGGWADTVNGVIFAVIFVFLVHPLMPGPNSALGNMAKAMAYAMALATFTCLVWVPGNFPDLDAGFFSFNLGWKTPLAIFLTHAIYGIYLGAFYNPLPEATAGAQAGPPTAVPGSRRQQPAVDEPAVAGRS